MLKPWGRSLLVVILVFALGACSSSGDGGGERPFSALFLDSESSSLEARGYENEPRLVLTGKTGAAYTVTVTEGGTWCVTSRRTHATTASGTLVNGRQIVYLYLDENDSGKPRHAEISVAFDGGGTFLLTLEQESYSIPASLDHAWAELPAYVDDDDFLYVTHFAPISSSVTARNYTICFDKTKRIANWVAYPLHDCYMSGTYVRSDAWAYDPEVPASYQADLTRGSYQNWQTNGIRGHQCMSNHRYVPYSDELNRQTFYSTNIMPQNSDFNSGSWGSMESVASAQRCSDTLYIVTGAVFSTAGGSESITYIRPAEDSKQCPVPNYYFKVVLKVKRSGSTITSAMAVGAWFEHRQYSDSWTNYVVSVDEIERLTGFDFFANLPDDVEAAAEQNGSWSTFSSF